jgi:hypothetical protein
MLRRCHHRPRQRSSRAALRAAAVIIAAAVARDASARPAIESVSDVRYGLTFAVPAGWRSEAHSTYQVIARGREGGLETHVNVFATAPNAVRDFFLVGGEIGRVEVEAQWTCADSRSWRLNPRVGVAVCAHQLANGHALVASLTAEKDWLRRAGGRRFLRLLVARMRGFRAEDD